MKGFIRVLLDLSCDGYFTEKGGSGGWWVGASKLFVLLVGER